jgi:hypothetical protein
LEGLFRVQLLEELLVVLLEPGFTFLDGSTVFTVLDGVVSVLDGR